MKKRFKTFAPGAGVTARVAPVAILTAAVVLAAGGGPTNDTQQDPHSGHDNNSAPATLVQVVRNSTGQFINVQRHSRQLSADVRMRYRPGPGCHGYSLYQSQPLWRRRNR